MTASQAPSVAEAREVVAGAIDSAIRELEVSIRYLRMRKGDLEAAPVPKESSI